MKNFDAWMKFQDPKYCKTDDTVQLRLLRECWHAAMVQAEIETSELRLYKHNMDLRHASLCRTIA